MKRLAHDRFEAQRPKPDSKVELPRGAGAHGPLTALAAAWRAAEPARDPAAQVSAKAPTSPGVAGHRPGSGPSVIR